MLVPDVKNIPTPKQDIYIKFDRLIRPSPVSSGIDSISHYPAQAKIVIQLQGTNETRTCVKPKFVGRLSGPYLSTIAWQSQLDNDQIVGYYQVPAPGRYFVEIISVLCNDFEFDTDFEKICLEDPSHHRVTTDDASVDVVVAATSSQATGYYQWTSQTEPSSLHTRYQPNNCRGTNSSKPRCTEPATLDRFAPYHFVWKNDDAELLPASSASDDETKLCLVGLSHARELKVHMYNWLQNWNVSDIHLQYFEARYPTDISARFVKRTVNSNCTKVILGLGQWPAGKKPRGYRPPTLFPAFKEQMINVIKLFQEANSSLYLRSIHYNPLGDLITQCPPKDWRSPATIDGYNAIIRQVSSEFNTPFINTHFIMGPLWDSAEDWCHYRGLAGSVEALYILREVLGADS
jgi:hypothetical protein